MTLTATQAYAPTRAAGGSSLAGTGTLVRFILRRERIRVPVWIAALLAVQVGGAASYPDIYPTLADRMAQGAVFGGNPAMKFMTGPGYGLGDYTYGAMMTNEFLGFMVIFVALMSVQMVVRHTRDEEETGRAELVRANVVGQYAHLTAALIVAVLTNLVLGGLLAVGMAGLGIETVDWTGSLVFGAAFAAVGIVFAAIASITTQVTEHARAATGMAGALIGAAYVVRGIGDMADNGLSWLSPIGWAQATAAYVDNNGWPLLLAVVVAGMLTVVGFVLSTRRDIGSGLRAERRGATEASRTLGTPMGIAWRLQRGGVFWWTVALLLLGSAYGSAVDIMEDYAGNDVVRQMVAGVGGASLTESWLSIVIALMAIVCTIFSVLAVLRLRREETSGRAEAVLATGLSRTRWVATHVVIALLGGTVLLAVAGLGLGATAGLLSGDAELFRGVVGAAVAYAPALWLTAGFAVTVLGVLPRAIGLAWAVLVYAFLVVYLGGLLDLPGWMLDLSPYNQIPRLPADEFTATPLVVLSLIAVGLLVIGFVGFRRRDLQSN